MSSMENPHEARQAVLLERIGKNVEKCFEAVQELNVCLNESIQAHASTTQTASALFGNYSRNVVYNLEAIGKMGEAR
ncbi:hypothetical protein FFLO_06714 [Filobasidium floriforme]|uniref:DASH complex subunit DAD4 n=1 Tax=Filobasidium floriforme TaxID=5210 RepID=A0A8K0JEU7_9TREE|nr:uncharacterized protein HD553DRAFT_320777 [Filobasidium floriforme]KAG7527652.1 hypothetical protein FFLO_06714 [Filobasidium floriforme]KAH8077455.1 hypothetical protein HD553DRAFT_320777 [Filobasidium floriforme]